MKLLLSTAILLALTSSASANEVVNKQYLPLKCSLNGQDISVEQVHGQLPIKLDISRSDGLTELFLWNLKVGFDEVLGSSDVGSVYPLQAFSMRELREKQIDRNIYQTAQSKDQFGINRKVKVVVGSETITESKRIGVAWESGNWAQSATITLFDASVGKQVIKQQRIHSVSFDAKKMDVSVFLLRYLSKAARFESGKLDCSYKEM